MLKRVLGREKGEYQTGLPAWTREGGRRGQRTALGTVQGPLRKFSCPLSRSPRMAGGKEKVGSDPHFKKVPQ